MYDNYNPEDQDLFVKIVNEKQRNDQKAVQKTDQEKYQDALNASIKAPVIPFKTRPKEKPKGYKKILISAALLISIGLGFTAGNYVTKTAAADNAYIDTYTAISEPVRDNFHKIGLAENPNDQIWSYDTRSMAYDVLENPSYDIDTRIYGCYAHMREYNRLTHMNEIFKTMNEEVTNHPELYSEEIKRACQYDTFQDYLDAKGLDLEEYRKVMDEILVAYGKRNANSNEVSTLLNEFNDTLPGGTR